MRFKYKKFIILSILVFIGFYLDGLRFTSSSASRSNPIFKKNSELITKFKYDSHIAHMYKNKEQYFIIVTKKSGPLWKSTYSISSDNVNDLSDNIRFLASLCSKNITVYSILNKDPNVSYIEAGPLFKRIRKNATLNVPIHFVWRDSITCSNLNAIAFSKNGKALYKFEYDKNNPIRFRWYHV